jgi:anaerobic ribonucleoside-triphosphate reductase activating protein
MKYGDIKMCDSANGDGVRVSLFVSGCRNHCPGCFNEATWDFDYGKEFTEIEANEILEGCGRSYISGCTILGGDPMEPENQAALLPLLTRFKEMYPEKTLWIYTGYILERDLLPGQRKHVEVVTDRILDLVDTLVDGPFIQAQRDLSLRFRGSSNQRLLSRAEIAELRK